MDNALETPQRFAPRVRGGAPYLCLDVEVSRPTELEERLAFEVDRFDHFTHQKEPAPLAKP